MKEIRKENPKKINNERKSKTHLENKQNFSKHQKDKPKNAPPPKKIYIRNQRIQN